MSITLGSEVGCPTKQSCAAGKLTGYHVIAWLVRLQTASIPFLLDNMEPSLNRSHPHRSMGGAAVCPADPVNLLTGTVQYCLSQSRIFELEPLPYHWVKTRKVTLDEMRPDRSWDGRSGSHYSSQSEFDHVVRCIENLSVEVGDLRNKDCCELACDLHLQRHRNRVASTS